MKQFIAIAMLAILLAACGTKVEIIAGKDSAGADAIEGNGAQASQPDKDGNAQPSQSQSSQDTLKPMTADGLDADAIKTAESLLRQQQDAREGKQSIIIDAFKFIPNDISIKKGTTVVWEHRNNARDNAVHKLKITENSQISPRLLLGESYNFTFTEAGEYHYFDVTMPSQMQGRIIVR